MEDSKYMHMRSRVREPRRVARNKKEKEEKIKNNGKGDAHYTRDAVSRSRNLVFFFMDVGTLFLFTVARRFYKPVSQSEGEKKITCGAKRKKAGVSSSWGRKG